MAIYYSSDINFDNLVNLVLRELKEPESTGSEAVPVDLVKDTINAVYADAFNDPRMKQSAREMDISFNLANDTTLAADAAVGAPTLSLADSTSFRSSGKVLLLSEIADYAGNAANTLTGVTNLNVAHAAGETVRQLYPLSSIASTIDADSILSIDINGIPLEYVGSENLISGYNYYPNSYSLYRNHLIFSQQSSTGSSSNLSKALMVYAAKVTPLSNTSDTPSLIPNSYRVPILVYGTCMRLAATDAFRTSWDWFKTEYEKGLTQYIISMNNRVKDRNNKRRRIYSQFI